MCKVSQRYTQSRGFLRFSPTGNGGVGLPPNPSTVTVCSMIRHAWLRAATSAFKKPSTRSR